VCEYRIVGAFAGWSQRSERRSDSTVDWVISMYIKKEERVGAFRINTVEKEREQRKKRSLGGGGGKGLGGGSGNKMKNAKQGEGPRGQDLVIVPKCALDIL